MAFVPLPFPPLPEPVVNDPKGSWSNGSPIALWPLTDQKMVLLAGKDDVGVQVSTVLPALQEGEVGIGLSELDKSKNVASVTLVSVSIAVLKVKTTVVVVETPDAPSAGTDETRVGTAACACHKPASDPAKTSNMTRSFPRDDF